MGLALLGLVVAGGTGQPVGQRQPEGQQDVQYDDAEQHNLKGLDYPVSTHEMAEGRVPGAFVVAQDEEVRCGVEQQEYQGKDAYQHHGSHYSVELVQIGSPGYELHRKHLVGRRI